MVAEGQGKVGEMQDMGMDLTVEDSCSRAPIWVHEDLLCRSQVGESTIALQSDQGWHRQEAGTQAVGGQPLLHREDMREKKMYKGNMKTPHTLLLNLCMSLSGPGGHVCSKPSYKKSPSLL